MPTSTPPQLVGGKKKFITVTPPVQAAAYAAGNVMGGVITLADALSQNISGLLLGAQLACAVNSFIGPVDMFVFSAKPTGTYTENTAFNLAAADLPNLIQVVQLANVFATGTGAAILNASPQANAVVNTENPQTQNVYVILVPRSAVTLATVTDIVLKVPFDLD